MVDSAPAKNIPKKSLLNVSFYIRNHFCFRSFSTSSNKQTEDAPPYNNRL